MKLSWINILLTLSVIATMSAGIMMFVNYKKYTAKTETITQAHNLLLETFEMRAQIKDAETGQRGYLLTGKIEYLKPYINSSKKLEIQNAKLTNMATRNELFKNDIEKLLSLVSAKHEELALTIKLKDSIGIDEALKVVNSDIGNRLMDSIRIQVDHILFKEQKLLSELNADYDQSVRATNTVRYCIQFFVICTIITAIILLGIRQRLNDKLVSELNEANANLESKVDQRTKELHEANQELASLNEEIQSQTDQIIVQNEKLVSMDTEKNKFIGIASHDLKSPINRIKGLLSIMRMSPDATIASQTEYFNMIEKTIKGMLQLLKDLLDINKIDQGRRDIHISKVDLNWIITNMCHIFEDQAHAKNISIECITSHENILIDSDEGILMQIMENLVSNAIKFTESDKSIVISISRNPEKVRLEVKDQGLGIPEGEMHLLFGKFQKLSSRPTAGEESTGLGLSIVKELVEELGGKIWCESKVGIGSTFIIELSS